MRHRLATVYGATTTLIGGAAADHYRVRSHSYSKKRRRPPCPELLILLQEAPPSEPPRARSQDSVRFRPPFGNIWEVRLRHGSLFRVRKAVNATHMRHQHTMAGTLLEVLA